MQRKQDGLVSIKEALAVRPGASQRGREMTLRLRILQGNNVLTATLTGLAIGLAVLAFTLPAKAQQPEQPDKYLILATSRTGTMQEELNEADARGYRVVGAQGGETAFGGNEAVVIMALDPEGRRFRYILLATSRTSTMGEELNEAPPEYDLVAMTVFSSRFGGNEAAAILEAEIAEE